MLTDETIDAIERDLSAGQSLAAIARKYRASPTTIYAIAKGHHRSRRPGQRNPHEPARYPAIFASQHQYKRCPQCGLKVQLPCLRCFVADRQIPESIETRTAGRLAQEEAYERKFEADFTPQTIKEAAAAIRAARQAHRPPPLQLEAEELIDAEA